MFSPTMEQVTNHKSNSLIPVCSSLLEEGGKVYVPLHPFLLFLAKCHRPASRVPVPSLRNHVRLVDSASASASASAGGEGEGEGDVAVGGGREQGRW